MVGVALLCSFVLNNSCMQSVIANAINQVLKSRRAILWPGAITPVMPLFKYNIFAFWAYNFRTYWTILLNAFSEPWLLHFTKTLITYVYKTELWIYCGTEYVNNVFPLLYVGVKFDLSNWENCIDSGAIQVSCPVIGTLRFPKQLFFGYNFINVYIYIYIYIYAS